MAGLYPDLSHLREEERAAYLEAFYNRSSRHAPSAPVQSSDSDSDEGPLPRGNRRRHKCLPCQCRLCEGLCPVDRNLGFLSHERNNESMVDGEFCGRGPLHQGKGFSCELDDCNGPFSSQYCGRCRPDIAGMYGRRPHEQEGSSCKVEGCGGPFSSEYCGHCRPDSHDIHGPRPRKGSSCEVSECGGPISSTYCGHCKLNLEDIHGPRPYERRGSSCEVDDCGGPFSSKYCGHCRPDCDEIHGQRPQERKISSCEVDECGGPFSSTYCGHCQPNLGEIHGPRPRERERSSCGLEGCGGPFSSSYCGRCRRASNDVGCHGNQNDDVTPGYRYEAGGSPDGSDLGYRYEIVDEGFPRGRNHVMERENIDDVMAKGPHWWSQAQHHIPPPHHVGLYSWVHCTGGDVPPSAVKVGRDEDGGRNYVGRAWHEGDLLPAKISPSHGGAFVPWGGLEHSKFDYEVLVSDSSRVAWQEAARGSVPPHALVVGHTSSGEALYVGRTLHHGIMTPGKVQHSHGTLYISWAGREINYDEYEVLVVVD